MIIECKVGEMERIIVYVEKRKQCQIYIFIIKNSLYPTVSFPFQIELMVF